MQLSIYTPCYNKGETIERTFNSLLNQSCTDFEWIVVNDGSTDNSQILIDKFSTDKFSIIKINQENKGLSSVMNTAIQRATGRFVLRLDGDDYLKCDAIEVILSYIEKDDSLSDPTIGALVFLTCDENGKTVGCHPFVEPTRCNFWDYRIKYKAKGDRAEVFKRDCILQFPMPIIEGEKFCPEAYVWNSFSDNYDAIFYTKKVYVRYYDPNCITSNIVKVLRKNPKGRLLCSIDILHRDLPFMLFFKESITYFRYFFCTGYSFKKAIEELPIHAIMIGVLPGFMLYLIDSVSPDIVQYVRKFLKV